MNIVWYTLGFKRNIITETTNRKKIMSRTSSTGRNRASHVEISSEGFQRGGGVWTILKKTHAVRICGLCSFFLKRNLSIIFSYCFGLKRESHNLNTYFYYLNRGNISENFLKKLDSFCSRVLNK